MTESGMAREVESVNHTWIVVGSDGEAGVALDVLGASSDPTALVVGSRDLAEHVARSVGDVRWIDAGGIPVAGGIFHLRFHVTAADVNGYYLIAADTPRQDLDAAPFSVEMPAPVLAEQRHRERPIVLAHHQNRPVRPDRHRRAQRLLALRDPARHRNHLRDHSLLLEPHRLFDRNLVERIHAHLHIGDVHARAVRLHTHLDVVIDNTLDRDENLHAAGSSDC